ncbi:MAG: hypothetical protein WBW04_14305 [Nitrolancea sp.]
MAHGIFMGKHISILGFALLISVGLAACGSSSSTPTTSTSGGGSATTATSTTASTATTPTTEAITEATPMASPAANEASPVAGSTTVLVRDDATLGKLLTDAKGFTLYFFTKDSDGKSVCNAGCAANWPPATADGTPTLPDGVTGTLSLITRDDGSKQLAYNGKALYTYIKDTDPEDTYGQGVGGVWVVATP